MRNILKVNYLKLIFSFLTVVAFAACGDDGEEKKDIPNVSNVVAKPQFLRFEQDLFAVKTVDDLVNLEKKYGRISDIFLGAIIQSKKIGETPPQYFDLTNRFLTDSFVKKTYDTTQIVFKNFEPFQKQLTEAATFYKYYFPELPDLTFVTFFSQYNYEVFPFGRDTIGIGLDFYLGAQHADYLLMDNIRYDYVRRTLTPEHLAVKALRLHISNMAGEANGSRLLDLMIHNGKQLFILDQLLPRTPDSLKFGYTATQTQWCKENEAGMWASFLKENVLYETNQKKIAKLISPSPNSPGMPAEAPGETGNYIGWQIVKQFMRREPKTTLTQLLQMRDAQQILEKSKYKPARIK